MAFRVRSGYVGAQERRCTSNPLSPGFPYAAAEKFGAWLSILEKDGSVSYFLGGNSQAVVSPIGCSVGELGLGEQILADRGRRI